MFSTPIDVFHHRVAAMFSIAGMFSIIGRGKCFPLPDPVFSIIEPRQMFSIMEPRRSSLSQCLQSQPGVATRSEKDGHRARLG
jgi:hypothetical protein